MAVADLVYNLVGHDRGASKAFKSVGDSSDHANRKMDRFKGLAGGVGAAAAALGAGALVVGKQLFDTAVSMEAMGNKAKVVFGKNFGDAQKIASELSESLGMTQTQVLGMIGSFGDLLTPMGFTSKQAVHMSGDLGTLTAALTQWSGGTKTSADIADMLSDALTGEYDSLKSLGVQIDADLIKQKLHAAGKDKLTGAALKQAEAEIALAEITAQSSNALAGYTGKTNKLGLAKQKLSSQIASAREALASKLLPVFVTATTWVSTKFIPQVQKLGGEFQNKFGPTLEKIGTMIRRDVFPAFQKIFSNPDVQNGLKKLGALVGIAAGAFAVGAATSIAFSGALLAAAGYITNKVGPAFKWLADKVMDALGAIVHGAAAAFGWVPGIGEKLKRADKAFAVFAQKVNQHLGGIRDRNVNVFVRTKSGVLDTGRDSLIIGRRAMGGPVQAGSAYVVGERGPEVVTFGSNGYVTPNHKLAGGVVVNVTGFVGSPAQLRAALVDAMRRGGNAGGTARFA